MSHVCPGLTLCRAAVAPDEVLAIGAWVDDTGADCNCLLQFSIASIVLLSASAFGYCIILTQKLTMSS